MIRKYWALVLAVAFVAIVGLTIAAWSGGARSEEELSIDKVPAPVKATILKVSEGGKVTEIERETKGGNTVYEAEFVINGRELEVTISPDGKVLGWEGEDADDDDDEVNGDDDDDDDEDEDADENLALDQLPAAVKATILKEAKGGKIKEIELENEHGKTLYEADVLVELEIQVAPDGTLLGTKIEAADDHEHEHHAVGSDDDDDDDDDD